MQSAAAEPAGSPNPNLENRAEAGTGRFMLTLCTLNAPVSLRPPRSPSLKPFTFFMNRARQPDGSERLYLHMGFFETLAQAERWAQSVRRHYPDAFATIAPIGLARSARPEVPTGYWARGDDAHLSDTQVMETLEASHVPAVSGGIDERDHDQIPLLRPEDTGIRKALKEAVVQGAPVSFAVQLQWTARPIDLDHVKSLDAFRGHTLYATESHRKGRSIYFLRVGFFSDPRSAKEVAVQVRATFASAAVIPVVEPEITRAREAAVSRSAIPNLVERRDEVVDFDSYESDVHPTRQRPSSRGQERTDGGHRARHLRDERETSIEAQLSDSGVRHLKVEVQEQLSGRWRVIKLRQAAEYLQVD
jgi:hypothetical protein